MCALLPGTTWLPWNMTCLLHPARAKHWPAPSRRSCWSSCFGSWWLSSRAVAPQPVSTGFARSARETKYTFECDARRWPPEHKMIRYLETKTFKLLCDMLIGQETLLCSFLGRWTINADVGIFWRRAGPTKRVFEPSQWRQRSSLDVANPQLLEGRCSRMRNPRVRALQRWTNSWYCCLPMSDSSPFLQWNTFQSAFENTNPKSSQVDNWAMAKYKYKYRRLRKIDALI